MAWRGQPDQWRKPGAQRPDMARIRTIKPEAPQSESLGRISRDARLLFFMLFTVADDAGRTRAAPRMLAGLLFPYDEDAPAKIPEWLAELEREKCIAVYAAEGNTYLQIVKWAEHQKIDKPKQSKLPAPPGLSTMPRDEAATGRDEAANLRDASRGEGDASPQDQGEDQGREGTKDQDQDISAAAEFEEFWKIFDPPGRRFVFAFAFAFPGRRRRTARRPRQRPRPGHKVRRTSPPA